MKFELPKLPYSYDALEPYVDAKTMEIHYSKHHQSYVTKLNDALAKHPEFQKMPLEELLRGLEGLPEDIQSAVQNNGGGHANHSLFWTIMKPTGKKEPKGELEKEIGKAFGGFPHLRSRLLK